MFSGHAYGGLNGSAQASVNWQMVCYFANVKTKRFLGCCIVFKYEGFLFLNSTGERILLYYQGKIT